MCLANSHVVFRPAGRDRLAHVKKIDFSYGGLIRLAVTAIAVAMGLYHMRVIVAGQPEAIIFRGTHLLFALVLVFLIYGPRVNMQRPIPSLIDYAWLALGVASLLHLFVNYEYVVTRIYYIDELTPADMIFGTILLVVVTEATRRCVDVSLPVTSILFLLYGLFIAGRSFEPQSAALFNQPLYFFLLLRLPVTIF